MLYTSLFHDGCHHVLATVCGGQIVLLQCWQVCLFYKRAYHTLMKTTVVRRERDKWVRCDQHIFMLYLFALENGVGYSNHITRGQKPGPTSHTPCRGLKWEMTHEKRVRRKPQKSLKFKSSSKFIAGFSIYVELTGSLHQLPVVYFRN